MPSDEEIYAMNNFGWKALNIGKLYVYPFILVFLAYGTSVLYLTPTQESSIVNQIVYTFAYAFSAGVLLTRHRRFLMFVAARSLPILVLILLAFVSIFTSDFPKQVFFGIVHKIGTVFVALLAAMLLMNNSILFFRSLLNVFFAYFVVTLLFSIYYPAMANMPEAFYGKFRAGLRGLTLHPNTLGGICVVSAWVSFSVMYLVNETRIWSKRLAIASILFALYFLYKSNSMTAILVVAGMFAIVIWFQFVMGSNSGVGLRIFFVVAGFFFLVSLLWVVKPEVFTIEYFFHAIGRDTSFSGRSNLWDLAIKGFLEKPYLGWGEDNLHTLLKHYRVLFAQFHNGYLDFLVRGGVVYVVILAIIFFQMLVSLRRMASAGDYLYLVVISYFVPWLVHNITEASIYRNTHILWFVFLICYFSCVGRKFSFKGS
ncbi:O-antigen ligase family protein [Methylococcaceae bacterium WWC4]|nr:O-antigen ligase family protein [Methylococcaceae bacterium WWC4]